MTSHNVEKGAFTPLKIVLSLASLGDDHVKHNQSLCDVING